MKLFEIEYEVLCEADDPHRVVVHMYAPSLARAKQRVHEEIRFMPGIGTNGLTLALYEYHPETTIKILTAKEI